MEMLESQKLFREQDKIQAKGFWSQSSLEKKHEIAVINRALTLALLAESEGKRHRPNLPGHTCDGLVAGAPTCKKCLTRKTPQIPIYVGPKLAAAHKCKGSPRTADTAKCPQCKARKTTTALPVYRPMGLVLRPTREEARWGAMTRGWKPYNDTQEA